MDVDDRGWAFWGGGSCHGFVKQTNDFVEQFPDHVSHTETNSSAWPSLDETIALCELNFHIPAQAEASEEVGREFRGLSIWE